MTRRQQRSHRQSDRMEGPDAPPSVLNASGRGFLFARCGWALFHFMLDTMIFFGAFLSGVGSSRNRR
jgi:hypothetical protein